MITSFLHGAVPAFKRIDIVTLSSLFFIIVAIFNISIVGEQQFVYLAQSFLHGKPWFLEMPGTWEETILYGGHYFWHLSPFPAVVLAPFVFVASLLHVFFYQGYLQILFTGSVYYCAFWLAQHFGYSKKDSLWLAFAFCFASVYQFNAFVPWSWYFAQVLAVFIMFVALVEFHTKRRYWLIGFLCAALFMTRFPAGFAALFFLLAICFDKSMRMGKKVKNIATIMACIGCAAIVLMGYNYARFSDPFESGYRESGNHYLSTVDRFETLEYGIFQLRNIPTNFYYYFLKTLDPVTLRAAPHPTYILEAPYVTIHFPGTSFFVVSPIFLYLFRAKWREKIVWCALAPVGLILFLLLTYYGPGWRQVGPRYLLDLLPLAYIVLLHSFPSCHLSRTAKAIIIASAFFDVFLFSRVMGQ